jgi:hypothetical protein
VFGIAVAAYEADGKKDDSLIEVLRDLSDFTPRSSVADCETAVPVHGVGGQPALLERAG